MYHHIENIVLSFKFYFFCSTEVEDTVNAKKSPTQSFATPDHGVVYGNIRVSPRVYYPKVTVFPFLTGYNVKWVSNRSGFCCGAEGYLEGKTYLQKWRGLVHFSERNHWERPPICNGSYRASELLSVEGWMSWGYSSWSSQKTFFHPHASRWLEVKIYDKVATARNRAGWVLLSLRTYVARCSRM